MSAQHPAQMRAPASANAFSARPSLAPRGGPEFTRAKRRALLLCMASYTVSYLCRTNLALALDDLGGLLSATRSAMGAFSTGYFWLYAVGQLVCGWLCTKFSAKKILSAGLVLTAACNLGVSFAHTYWGVFFLWMANGFALALFWPSLVQLSAQWIGQDEYMKVSILLNLPTTVGYFLGWGLLGAVKSLTAWQYVFRVPALLAVGFLFFWVWAMPESPQAAGFAPLAPPAAPPASGSAASSTAKTSAGAASADAATSATTRAAKTPATTAPARAQRQARGESLLRILGSGTMLGFALIILAHGSTKESVNLWAPSLLADAARGQSSLMVNAFTSLVPLFSTCGLLLTGWSLRRGTGGLNRVLLLLVLGGAAAAWALVFWHTGTVPVLLFLGLLLAVLYGSATLLTTLVPLRFAYTGRVAQISGIFNFLAYLGAALGGLLSGWAYDALGWGGVYLLWAVLNTAALLVQFASEWLHSR